MDSSSENPACSISDLHTMLNNIASTPDIFIQSQQINDPEFTFDQKINILSKLYSEKPAIFLSRYESLITPLEAVSLFSEKYKLDDDVRFYVDRIMNNTSHDKNIFLTRNRRFLALKRMLKTDNYFSNAEMRKRHPLMYDRMIGRFQNREEYTQSLHSNEKDGSLQPKNLSSMLLDMYDSKIIGERKKAEFILEKMTSASMNDEDDPDDDNDEELDESEEEESTEPKLSTAHNKEVSKKFFLDEMIENFMEGEDEEFYDYKANQVNIDVEKELIRLQEQDEQDHYFEDEDDTAIE